MKQNESNIPIKYSSSGEAKDFFSSLNEFNEEKYILALKNSSLKIWAFLNEDGLTSLHKSISLNLFELSKEIIESANKNLSQKDFISFINCKTKKGQTPLHYASFVGNIKIIKILIQNGADILSKTNNGFNVLHLATMGNKMTSFFYFIEKYKININSKDVKDNTSLHLSTYFNSKKIFNFLLTNSKIDINAKNKEGFTPLHFAVMSQNKSMIKKLLIKGADCNIKNDKLLTPIDIAKKNNYHSITNIFKGRKCKYKILMYSRYTIIFLIFLSFLQFFGVFYINFDYKSIFYILWIIIFIIIIIRFYLTNPTNYNKEENYLINLLEIEEKVIEDYCMNCQIIQHINTVHCFVCNKCIEGFDHHCFWINKCVGEKNKTKFYQLIWAMEINIIINFFVSILEINKKKNKRGENFNQKDLFRVFIIILNTLILIFASIVICPLIKFYYYQSKEKTSNTIDYNNRKSTRLLNKLDEEEFI